jgi:hypothetical protein
MKYILLTSIILGYSAYAQNTHDILRSYFNPSTIYTFNDEVIYTHTDILNAEFGIINSKVGSIFNASNRPFHLSYQQFGYKHFRESKFSISTASRLSTNMSIGINFNLNSLAITDNEKLNALDFDLGFSLIKELYQVRIFIENPFNNSYINNDIESRFIINGVYFWNRNLASEVQFEESIHTGFHGQHLLRYTYKDVFSLQIIQSINPFEYGIRFGYKKDQVQFYTQFQKLAWTNSTGFALIYTLPNE